ncbi:hypothetical protein HOE39_02185 [Candidatus Woesearchaeota archaeon]|nr:hypothetical protein [Candidatus Woesearchaeota archaeon]
MRILWVEDEIEENTDISVTKVFRSLDLDLHEVVQIRSFDEAYEIINDLHITLQLENIDFVVLDIDLSKSVPGEHTRKLTKQFEPKDDFLIKAGFDLFIQLIEQGFPRDRIIFYTANTSHGNEELLQISETLKQSENEENELAFEQSRKLLEDKLPSEKMKSSFEESIESGTLSQFLAELESELQHIGINQTYEELQEQFRTARIEVPNAESKLNSSGLEPWLQKHFKRAGKNKTTFDYLTLRRGILNVLDELSETSFTKDFSEDFNKSAFFESLRWLLQAHELNPDCAGQFYLTLCDTLTKPFEKFKLRGKDLGLIPRPPLNRSSRIPVYFLRNWIAHGLLSESDTPNFKAQDAGFIFLLAMQSMFGLEMYGRGEELKLLFGEVSVSDKEIRNKIVSLLSSKYKSPFIIEKLEEIKNRGEKIQKGKQRNENSWKEENFVFHLYTSYLLASTKLVPEVMKEELQNVEVNNKRDDRYSVSLNYELQPTPFLGIALKRIQEL